CNDDCDSICVVEQVGGSKTPVESSTKATGNILANDEHLDNAVITKINDVGPNGSGDIIVRGFFGPLTVDITEADAGKYSYELAPGKIPNDGAKEDFKYTIFDADCNTSDCADLKIDINVKHEHMP